MQATVASLPELDGVWHDAQAAPKGRDWDMFLAAKSLVDLADLVFLNLINNGISADAGALLRRRFGTRVYF